MLLENIRLGANIAAFTCFLIIMFVGILGSSHAKDVVITPMFMIMCLFAAIAIGILVWHYIPMLVVLFFLALFFVILMSLEHDRHLWGGAAREVGTALYQIVELISDPAPGENP